MWCVNAPRWWAIGGSQAWARWHARQGCPPQLCRPPPPQRGTTKSPSLLTSGAASSPGHTKGRCEQRSAGRGARASGSEFSLLAPQREQLRHPFSHQPDWLPQRSAPPVCKRHTAWRVKRSRGSGAATVLRPHYREQAERDEDDDSEPQPANSPLRETASRARMSTGRSCPKLTRSWSATSNTVSEEVYAEARRQKCTCRIKSGLCLAANEARSRFLLGAAAAGGGRRLALLHFHLQLAQPLRLLNLLR